MDGANGQDVDTKYGKQRRRWSCMWLRRAPPKPHLYTPPPRECILHHHLLPPSSNATRYNHLLFIPTRPPMFARLNQLARHFSRSLPNYLHTSAAAAAATAATSPPSLRAAMAHERNIKPIHTAACLVIGDEVLGGKVPSASPHSHSSLSPFLRLPSSCRTNASPRLPPKPNSPH